MSFATVSPFTKPDSHAGIQPDTQPSVMPSAFLHSHITPSDTPSDARFTIRNSSISRAECVRLSRNVQLLFQR